MNRPLGTYLDDYSQLVQPGVSAELYELVRSYPWFTLGRYMQLRSLLNTDPDGYNRAARLVDVRLFAHPYPRILLTDDENRATVPAFLPPSPVAASMVYSQESADTVSVIDDFLNKDISPKITPPPAPIPGSAYWQEEDISADSVAQDGEIATEILAEIYLAQGLPDRAVEIYYKLSLKYPEKSAYFANLIAGIQARNGNPDTF